MLYDIGFLLFSILYIPTLIFKGKLHKDFLERFGIYGDPKRDRLFRASDVIWIQAVSVGEVALCKNLIPLIKKEFPERSIVLSTITKTGNDLAKKLFSGSAEVIYFPLDFSFTVKRAIDRIRPKIYIMIETEIWPNVLGYLKQKRRPAVIINGRISDRSYGKYKIVRRFMKKAMEDISLFCMQSDTDAERIISLGARADRVRVTGTMKFDAEALKGAPGTSIKEVFGVKADEKIFVAGSTHGGEEEHVLLAYKELVKRYPEMKLVIAPRHIERIAELEGIVTRSGLRSLRMSGNGGYGPDRRSPGDVYLIDKIGYLNDAYSVSEIVFIGGSLVPHGGQNPIEPAVFGKPVMFGPYMFNFKAVASLLLSGGGAVQVKSGKDIYTEACRIMDDPDLKASLGRNAKKIIDENRGATIRNINAIKEIMHD